MLDSCTGTNSENCIIRQFWLFSFYSGRSRDFKKLSGNPKVTLKLLHDFRSNIYFQAIMPPHEWGKQVVLIPSKLPLPRNNMMKPLELSSCPPSIQRIQFTRRISSLLIHQGLTIIFFNSINIIYCGLNSIPPKSIRWRSKPQYLGMSLYLEMEAFK